MDIKKIKYNHALIQNKIRLETELKMVKTEIENIQESCNHIKICLGYAGQFQTKNTSINLCLFCRENNPESKYKIVDATNYRKSIFSHGQRKSYREERLLELQEKAMNIITNDPSITEEKLVEELIKIIEDDKEKTELIEKRIGYKFV